GAPQPEREPVPPQLPPLARPRPPPPHSPPSNTPRARARSRPGVRMNSGSRRIEGDRHTASPCGARATCILPATAVSGDEPFREADARGVPRLLRKRRDDLAVLLFGVGADYDADDALAVTTAA